jgi:chaperonin cofactor prefoldin
MKYFFIISVLLALSFGCNQAGSTNESSDAQEYFSSQRADSVAIEGQVHEFMFAFMGGDPDIALEYIYPEIFEWLQKTSPNEKNIKRQVMTMMKNQVEETKKELEKRGEQIDLRINRIRFAGTHKNERFYMVNLTMLIEPIGAKKGDPIKGLADNIIAVTNDNGRNCKFLQYDEDATAPVLRMNHPDKLVYDLLQLKDDQPERKRGM